MRQHQRVSSNKVTDLLSVELSLVVTALKTNTLCKLTYSDSIKFEGLINNIFSGVDSENSSNENLTQAIKDTFHELGYQVDNRQVMFMFS